MSETRNIPPNLPDVEFVDTDTETLVNRLISGYEKITGRTLYPADPVRAFILWLASVIVQERILINESAKQNLPRYAVGKNLDSLSEIFHNTYRLQAAEASTTLRFFISKTLNEDYIITDRLEVTVDGFISFYTVGHLIFKAGEEYADVEAQCNIAGPEGNGFAPGQVNKLVSDEFLYFKEVSNITTTAGGSGIEDDVSFYNRLRESEESYTTAGSRGSYIYHAKSVSSQISDVSAESPVPGVVDIRILLHGGVLPDEELLQKVKDYLSADDIRPLTDLVTVGVPEIIEYEIEAVYYISYDKMASTKEIRQAAEAAAEEYAVWQSSKMGRDINPSYLNALLMDTGIKRVEITSPVFTPVSKGNVAVLKSSRITYGGMEDD